MRKLKGASLLLTIAVSLLQVHFCGPTFRLPDGQLCATCPTLSDSPIEHEIPEQIEANTHGDCHDCCQLTDCSDADGKHQVASLSIPHIDFFVLPEPVVKLSFSETLVPVSVDSFEPGAPPTGPPSEHASRAPPASDHSTSAGRAVLIA